MTTALLCVDDVTKVFDTDNGPVDALAPTSFSIGQGEFVSLVGPSGCGKTTLMRVCAGLLPPTAGSVEYGQTGRPIAPGTFGMVFQQPALLEWRTVLDNLLLPAQLLGRDRAAATDRATELLAMVNLTDARDRLPKQLSGGMQQRVAIARALVHDPEVLFMDEPLAALDAFTREALQDDLVRLHRTLGKTVLFVTHDIGEAVYLSDRVLVMDAHPGRIVAEDHVDLPQPRDRGSEEFLHQIRDVRTRLNTQRAPL